MKKNKKQLIDSVNAVEMSVCRRQWPPSLSLSFSRIFPLPSLSEGSLCLSLSLSRIFLPLSWLWDDNVHVCKAKFDLPFWVCERVWSVCVWSVICFVLVFLAFLSAMSHSYAQWTSEDSVWGKTSRESGGGACVLCWSRVCVRMVALFGQMLVLTLRWNFQCAKTPASSELNTAHPSVLMQMRACVCVSVL